MVIVIVIILKIVGQDVFANVFILGSLEDLGSW